MPFKTVTLTEQLFPGIRNVSTCPSPAEVKSANTFKNEKVTNGISKPCVFTCGGRKGDENSCKAENQKNRCLSTLLCCEVDNISFSLYCIVPVVH